MPCLRGQRPVQVPMRAASVFYKQLAPSSAPTRHLSQHRRATSTSPTTKPNRNKRVALETANPPASTRPASLDLPAPIATTAPTADKLKRCVALGRAFLSFYKTGVKNVFLNYRASMPHRRTLGLPAYIPVLPTYTPSTIISSSSSSSSLTRAEHQLIRRSARDIRRMIPFTLILIICGEFTPLVVPLFGSAITPATCRVPSQAAKESVSAAARKRAALQAHSAATRGSLTPFPAGSDEELRLLATEMAPLPLSQHQPNQNQNLPQNRGVDATDVLSTAPGVLRACAVFGLVKSHDRTMGSLLVPWVYRPRLRKYLDYLAVDDELIRGAGGVDALLGEEVRIAVDERGGVDVAGGRGGKERGQAEAVERRWLERWLDVRATEMVRTNK